VTNFVIANANTNSVDQTILERAYEAACDELQKKHNINHAALAELTRSNNWGPSRPVWGRPARRKAIELLRGIESAREAAGDLLERLRATQPPIIDTLAAVSSVKAASRSRENFP
jgi:hypothetical protein